jgi:hypothetical protein
MDDESRKLTELLRRAWYRLSACACHGDEGSPDYTEHQLLLDEIDKALPLCRNMKSDG